MAQITGLQITTNIPIVLGQFDDLITHINTTLSKPFNMSLNVENIQQQLQQVNTEFNKLKEQIVTSGTNKSLINSTETNKEGREIGKTIEQIKEQLLSLDKVTTVKINSSDINASTKEMDSFIITVTKATGAIEKLKYESSGLIDNVNGISTPIYSQTKVQSVTDNTQAVAQANATKQQALDQESLKLYEVNEKKKEQLINEEYNKKLELEREYQILFERNAIIREQKEAEIAQKSISTKEQQEIKDNEVVQKYLQEIELAEQKKQELANKSYELKMKQEADLQVQFERGAILQEQQSANKYSSSVNQGEDALLAQEKAQVSEITSLMQTQYDLGQQIASANQKGNIPLEQALTLRKEEISLQLEQVNSNLSNASEIAKNAIIEKGIQLKSDEAIANSKLEGQEALVTAEVQKRILEYQRLKEVELQNLQNRSYSPSLDTAVLKNYTADLKNMGNEGIVSISQLNTRMKDLNLTQKEMEANAKTTSIALKEEASAGNAFSSMISDMTRMIPMMAGMAIIFGTISAIKSGLGTIVELDTNLATLSITMNTTSQGLIAITHNMQDTAIATGSNVSEVEKAVKIYANLGETAQTSLAKAKSSIMLSNVTGLAK